MDTLTKLKAQKDLTLLYEARLVLFRYIMEHQRMMRYKDSTDVRPNIEILKTLRPAYKHFNKVVDMFDKEFRRSFRD